MIRKLGCIVATLAVCSLYTATARAADCNTNGIADNIDISGGQSHDCDTNGIPDECELVGGVTLTFPSTEVPLPIPDGTPAGVQSHVTVGQVARILDVNVHLTASHTWAGDLSFVLSHSAQTCTLASFSADPGPSDWGDTLFDDQNGTQMTGSTPGPYNGTFRPLQLLSVFNNTDMSGVWTLNAADNVFADTGTLSSWSLIITPSPSDCNTNGTPDACDNLTHDANHDGTPDECQDCNTNGIPDPNEPGYNDCNTNATADFCEISLGQQPDCNTDTTLDICQLGGNDCNTNGSLDLCDIRFGGAADCNSDGVPDACQFVDCNTNGILDSCDIPPSHDCNTDGVPDECQLSAFVDFFDQPANGINGEFSDPTCSQCGTGQQSIADNFVLTTSKSIGQILLPAGGYFPGNSAYASDNFTVIIHADSGGLPGAAIATQNGVASSRVDTGFIEFGVHRYSYVLTLAPAVALSPGTYWLEIFNSGAGSDTWYWGTGDPTDSGSIPNSAFATSVPGAGWLTISGSDQSFSLVQTGAGDCNTNGVPDVCDLLTGDADHDGTVDVCQDCNTNGIQDPHEPGYQDCNSNATADFCEIGVGTGGADCNTDNTLDVCQLPTGDCNTNGTLDVCDIGGGAADCNTDHIPDACQLTDCNTNGQLDACDIPPSGDCNTDGVPDECQLSAFVDFFDQPANGINGEFSDPTCSLCFTGQQSIADNFVLTQGRSIGKILLPAGGYFPADAAYAADDFTVIIHADAGGLPGAAIATESNVASTRVNTGFVEFGVHRYSYELTLAPSITLPPGTYWLELFNSGAGSDTWYWGTGDPTDSGSIPNSAFATSVPGAGWIGITGSDQAFSLIQTGAGDCNTNGRPDVCDLGTHDSNNDGTPDECQDCDTNGIPDPGQPGYQDCNSNATADFCEIGVGSAGADCNTDNTLDACQLSTGDCNTNGTLDVCDILNGGADCNSNHTLDICELVDCNTNGRLDACDIPPSGDCNTDGIPDECQLAGSVEFFDQPANGVNGEFSDPTCSQCGTGQQSIADNFILSTALSIGEIDVPGGYFPTDAPYASDDFTVIIHADAAGLPGAALATRSSVPSSRVNTGIVEFGVHRYAYKLTISPPVALSPGIYWVEVFNSGAGSDTWYWATGNQDPTNGILNSAFATIVPGSGWFTNFGTEQAFTLFSSSPGDCNTNGRPDVCDLATGDSDHNGTVDVCEDCNTNGIPDPSEPGYSDCNTNHTADQCEIAAGGDCNTNNTLDVCELAGHDCDTNGTLDRCEVAGGPDCNTNLTPDACEGGCNTNNTPDICDVFFGGAADCNTDRTPDECELSGGGDCNTNGVPDACDVLGGATDCNSNHVPDVCDLAASDCNTNGIVDGCDVRNGATDCNSDQVPDVCQLGQVLAVGNSSDTPQNIFDDLGTPSLLTSVITLGQSGTVSDVNVQVNATHTFDGDLNIFLSHQSHTSSLANRVGGGNDNFMNTVFDDQALIPIAGGPPGFAGTFKPSSPLSVFNGDPRQGSWTLTVTDNAGGDSGTLLAWSIYVAVASLDCNTNGQIDACEAGRDCNTNLTPDECEITGHDCNSNGTIDACETPDCNTNHIPDACELSAGPLTTENDAAIPPQVPVLPPDSNPAGINSVITVAGSGALTDVNVHVSATHTWGGDLTFALSHGATATTLRSETFDAGPGTWGNTMFDDAAALSITTVTTTPFNGTFKPEQALSAYNGQDKSGTWTLNIADVVGGDTGTLLAWSLDITYHAGTGDCDTNGIPDVCEPDANSNGTPDACETNTCPHCTGDINGDNFVDGADIAGWVRCSLGAGTGADSCACTSGMTLAQFINKLLTDPNTACP